LTACYAAGSSPARSRKMVNQTAVLPEMGGASYTTVLVE
jgi:hypothetical protein